MIPADNTITIILMAHLLRPYNFGTVKEKISMGPPGTTRQTDTLIRWDPM